MKPTDQSAVLATVGVVALALPMIVGVALGSVSIAASVVATAAAMARLEDTSGTG